MHFPLIKPPPIHLALKCWIVKTDYKNPDSYLVRVGMWIVGGRWDTQNIFKNFLCRVATGPYTSDREERIWLPNYTLLHPIVSSSEGAWVSQMSLRLSVHLSVRLSWAFSFWISLLALLSIWLISNSQYSLMTLGNEL